MTVDFCYWDVKETQPQPYGLAACDKSALRWRVIIEVPHETDPQRVIIFPICMSTDCIPIPAHERFIVEMIPAFYEFHPGVIADILIAFYYNMIVPDSPPRDGSRVLCEAVMDDNPLWIHTDSNIHP